jgi:hypothetical protein
MGGAGRLFHKAIIQSNPLGLQFRSIVVADFVETLKRRVGVGIWHVYGRDIEELCGLSQR